MSLKIYNVLNNKKEEFIPLEEGKVKMYACGITASGEAHIGHAYQAIVFDIIRKYLEYKGYKVTYVRNYTDVDDKIIIKARELHMNPKIYANKMMKSIDKALKEIKVDKPTIESKATKCIPDIIEFIKKLIEKGYAYVTEEGNVFFEVAKFSEYGKLSHQKLDEQLTAVRKELEPGKKSNKDFALWKNAKEDEIWWDSPWGKGRPGWHIECSAMSMKYLGEQLDIHGGGKDLIFPHHENEIAQSESLTGKRFANFWIHNGLIKVNNQKMSKSLNNGIILKDLLKKYNFEVIRLALENNNYRSDLNIIDGIFEEKEKQLYSMYKTIEQLIKQTSSLKPDNKSKEYLDIINNFSNDMDDDFNFSLAISRIYEYLNRINKNLNEEKLQEALNIYASIKDTYHILGLFTQDSKEFIDEIKTKYLKKNKINETYINKMIEKRNTYKKEKKYDKADKIRQLLISKEIVIKDTKEKTLWDINI